jgi:hypothetical protein
MLDPALGVGYVAMNYRTQLLLQLIALNEHTPVDINYNSWTSEGKTKMKLL